MKTALFMDLGTQNTLSPRVKLYTPLFYIYMYIYTYIHFSLASRLGFFFLVCISLGWKNFFLIYLYIYVCVCM